ncbi:MAG: hypothetical protein FJ298_01570 [Planctomycetes bacterium]|nr:hypothetical protein [Planctomycetota bacterium]
MSEHRHFDEQTLLEAALDPQAHALRAQVHSCAQCSSALRKLGAFADDLRLQLLAEPAAQARTARVLSERVLARTTREDLSRGGDLRLVARFALERVRSSSALRLAAALLVAHLFALPVLAWIVLRAPRRTGEFQTRIETPSEPYFSGEGEREPDLVPNTPLPEGEPRAVEVAAGSDGADWLVSARRSERAALVALAPKPWSEGAPTEPLAQLLWLRAARLAGRELPDWVLSRAPDGAPSRMAIWTEILLDEWALSGARPAHLEAALARLAALPDFQRSRLVACALQRAAAGGAIEAATLVDFQRPSADAREVAERAAKESLARLARDALGDHRDAGSSEREAALDAWGAPRRP